jgi:queuine tRNA-ribosyltransferase catalytic subunit
MVKRDTPGYAIGGLAGGEDKGDFCRTVFKTAQMLPNGKPKYVMGIGYVIDLLICSLLGADMFDCVYATRTARFGNVFTRDGDVKIKNAGNKFDFGPIDSDCKCPTCKKYTRSFLHHLFLKDSVSLHHLSLHNVYFLIDILREFRDAILNDCAEEYLTTFVSRYYKNSKEGIPQWVVNSLKEGGVDIGK